MTQRIFYIRIDIPLVNIINFLRRYIETAYVNLGRVANLYAVWVDQIDIAVVVGIHFAVNLRHVAASDIVHGIKMVRIPFKIDRSIGTNREIIPFDNAVFPGLRNVHNMIGIRIEMMIPSNRFSIFWQCVIGYDCISCRSDSHRHGCQ